MHEEEFEERFEEMIREREMYSECFIEGNSIKVQKLHKLSRILTLMPNDRAYRLRFESIVG